MTISDETLSAFLDAALPPAQMAAVREAIALDEALTERLAELALVDQLVAETYKRIDQVPLPATIHQLLDKHAKKSATVIRFPTLARIGRQPRAMAAGLVIAVGLATILSLNQGDKDGWSTVAEVLETSPSGDVHSLSDGRTLTPRLTFVDKEGDYCRVYRQGLGDGLAREGIGCRRDGQWQPVAQGAPGATADGGLYRTASGPQQTDHLLDQMISGDPLDAAAETQLMASNWHPVNEEDKAP